MSANSSPYPRPDSLANLVLQAESWARQAGQMAMRNFKRVNTVVSKADDTLLTATDLEIEAFLTGKIRAAFPDHNLLAEEGTQTHQPSPYTWIADPLDGTTAFVRGLPGWGISLGLLDQNQPIFGLYYMPLLDDLTYATPQAVYWNGQRLRQTVSSNWNGNGFLAVNAGAHHDFEIGVPLTRTLGSVSASLVYTARGSATAAFIPRAYLWDLAAGALILTQAGGELRYLSGRSVDLGALRAGQTASEPILAGRLAIIKALSKSIQRKSTEKSL
jgi:myo-inositol-1(or 4)-monophosphatase